MILTPNFPLSFSDKGGYQKIRTKKQLAKFHLTNLLLTNPGEKISLPDYGVGLRQYLFENIVEDVLSDITINIETQIDTYLSYINLQNVSIVPTETNSIKITINYNLANSNINDQLNIEINGNLANSLDLGSSY